MANDYFEHLDNVVPKGARAIAAHVNNVGTEIEVGFDKLPTETELKQGTINYSSTETGVANAYVITLPYIPTLSAGLKVAFIVTNANTGASTLNANSTGIKSIKHSSGVALVIGDLAIGQYVEAIYDGTDFLITAKESSAAGIKTLYESNANTNEFNDTEKTKLSGAEVQSNKGNANGYAELDSSGRLPSLQLPSNINADTLDGNDSLYFASAGHNHDLQYSSLAHLHSSSEITDLTIVDGVAWTPELRINNSATGIAGTFTGTYSRTGNIVTASFSIALTSKGASSGNVTITGLPVAALSGMVSAAGSVYHQTTLNNPGLILPSISSGASSLNLNRFDIAGSIGTLTNVDITDTQIIRGSITYIIN